MLSRANNVPWISETEDNSWATNPNNNNNNNNNHNNNNINNNDSNNVVVVDNVNDVVSMSSFKSMLEVDNDCWYNTNTTTTTTTTTTAELTPENLLLNPPLIDSSSSCSPSPSVVFNSSNLDPSQIPYLFPQNSNIFGNPLPQSFNLGGGGFFQEISDLEMNRGNNNHNNNNNNNVGVLGGFGEFVGGNNDLGNPNLVGNSHFSSTHLVQLGDHSGFGSDSGSKFRGFEDGLVNSLVFNNRTSKILKPLDNSDPPVGSQPTLFQKRAALRKNFGTNPGNLANFGSSSGLISDETEEIINNNSGGKLICSGENEKKRKFGSLGILDNVSFTGSEFNYDSDDFTENNDACIVKIGDKNGGGTNSNANSSMTGNASGSAGGGRGDFKGKKKGMPAKNLMAERRRRKKLNDRLYMLRSVVPKISKMDRASILGDAIEYLRELLQKINDLHNELESSPPASTLTQTTNFHPLTPTLPNLPSRIKEELCPSSLPSPNGQPARIEVRLREGRAVNIHMFCGRRPGLLLSTMRALDGLGLDIQQAVISCFNGFAMDIFRAEQCKDGQDVHPEQIKGLLMELATFHGSNIVGNCNM